jgi:hypothetical protein
MTSFPQLRSKDRDSHAPDDISEARQQARSERAQELATKAIEKMIDPAAPPEDGGAGLRRDRPNSARGSRRSAEGEGE